MLDKRHAPLLGFIALYVFLIIVVNLLIQSSLHGPSRPAQDAFHRVSQQPHAESRSQKSKNVLSPDDLRRYNIVEQKRHQEPSNQLQWDYHVKKTFGKNDAFSDPRDREYFEGIKKTPEEYQRQWQKTERMIEIYEEELRRSPGDEETRESLQRLYLLRSTLSTLKKNIVTEK